MIKEEKQVITSFHELLEELRKKEGTNTTKQITINIHIDTIKELYVEEFYVDTMTSPLVNPLNGRDVKGTRPKQQKNLFSVEVKGRDIPFKVIDFYN